ncbi:hypothetical protein phiST2_0334 [Vibrio phage phi-ST2]|uniref:Uncharacterized protein n=3 Tax=Schizotequatrovirus TaxID=1198137 RepID=A0A140B3J7_9CAUD|nr:Rz-like spanin [Vibrio phage VH7D]YP_009201277.1 Rz-like spanin [Vibrio phage ValKK3]ALP47167.1 hypothetical protein phiGrn1_0201 [Vibrio phage phi-Grn1]ALP47553.1 hypothetical protein phiST2_0334 [Vibrio phage phi-ST2]AGB07094.1 hypothetical protein [Vibrio phage VH7D]AJT61015.1 hypothetical protein [Vibrio phage ValKK3]
MAVAAVFIGSIGYLKYENVSLEKDLVTQTAEVERLTGDNERLQTTIKNKNLTIDQWRSVYREQEQYRKTLQTELDKLTATIDTYKSRQDIVFQKPGLVQIKEQKALDKFFDEVRNGQ